MQATCLPRSRSLPVSEQNLVRQLGPSGGHTMWSQKECRLSCPVVFRSARHLHQCRLDLKDSFERLLEFCQDFFRSLVGMQWNARASIELRKNTLVMLLAASDVGGLEATVSDRCFAEFRKSMSCSRTSRQPSHLDDRHLLGCLSNQRQPFVDGNGWHGA